MIRFTGVRLAQTIGTRFAITLGALAIGGASLGTLAFATDARAQTQEEPERLFLLGAGVYATTNPYASAKKKTETGVLPLFFYQDRRFTADLSGLAIKAFGNDHIKLEGRVAPRFQLVDPKDTRDFAFLERDTGFDLGGKLSGTAGPITASVEYLHGVAGDAKGQEINFDLTAGFSPTEQLSVEVAAGLSWKDEKLATWLYGLTEKEVGRARAYQFGRTPGAPTGGVLVPSLGVQARYQLTDRLYLIAAAEVERFDDDITDSPLIAKKQTAAGFVSLVRRF